MIRWKRPESCWNNYLSNQALRLDIKTEGSFFLAIPEFSLPQKFSPLRNRLFKHFLYF